MKIASKGLVVPKKHEAQAVLRENAKMKTPILLEFFLKRLTVSQRFKSYGFLQVQSFKPYPDCTSTMWYADYFESEGIHDPRHSFSDSPSLWQCASL
jgi:hypothetical protein